MPGAAGVATARFHVETRHPPARGRASTSGRRRARPARSSGPARDSSSTSPPMNLGELARDCEPEPAARSDTALRPVEAVEDVAARARPGRPGPSSSTSSRRARVGVRPQRHPRPGGVCTSALSTSARPICSMRSSSPRAIGRPRRPVERWLLLLGDRGNSSATSCATAPRSTGSCSTRIRPASRRRGRAGRWRASPAARPARASSRGTPAASPRRALVRHQLQEAAEREERRAQLVRGVRDELSARAVELLEPDAHAFERRGQLAELVLTPVDDRLVEASARDPLRCALEPPDPACMHRRQGVPGHDRRTATRSRLR